MDMEWTRDTLRFESLTAQGEEQIVIEGDAALPGSMRDAVTVLSVQAQAHIRDVQAGAGEVGLRGRMCFQVLYTQGDLTRVRSLETTCDFERTVRLPGAAPGMRIEAQAYVQETGGSAGSGRITLRALLSLTLLAFETMERQLLTGAPQNVNLRVKTQSLAYSLTENIGEERTLVRDEQDLLARLGVGDVLNATASANVEEITGGGGKIGVSGTITVRAVHLPQEAGQPLVSTLHEVPYETMIPGQIPEGVQVSAQAEVTDVMADSVLSDKRRTLRLEAEVCVRLMLTRQRECELMTDLYSLSGPVLEPQAERFAICTAQERARAQESTRLQVTLPKDAPPVDTVLAAFAQPVLASVQPSGRRLDAEGVMGVTLVYIPQDSDVPCAVHVREPFAMTFPVETGEGVLAYALPVECSAGAVTSDRVEVRCVLAMNTLRCVQQTVSGVTGVEEKPEQEMEHGFVLVWPAAGESRWDTARRLRVAEETLHAAGKRALLAFRR